MMSFSSFKVLLCMTMLFALAQESEGKLNSYTEKKNLTLMETICERNGYGETSSSSLYERNEYDDIESRGRWSPDEHDYGYRIDDQPCASARSNVRATYTSHLVPCSFTFHIIEEEEGHGPMELSGQCSQKNEVVAGSTTVLKDYVVKWPDECVADFDRCYSVDRHDKIFAKTFCLKRWTLPEGVTHIAVDCREDKAMKNEAMEERKAKREKQQEEELERQKRENERYSERQDEHDIRAQDHYFTRRDQELKEVITVMLVGVVAILFFCTISMFCTYRKVFKPLLRHKEKTDEDSFELSSLVLHPSNSGERRGSSSSSNVASESANLSYQLLPNQHRLS